MNSQLNGQLENAGKSLEKKMASGAELAKNAKEGARRTASQVEDTATDTLSSIQSSLQDGWKDLSANAVMARDASESFIRSRPFYAVLGAAAVGVVIGAAFSMSRRK